MSPAFCELEGLVLEAVRSGRWPERCDAELRAHVSQCPVCADVVLVAEHLELASDIATAEIALPPAGLVWWKAQLKARREAVQRASEPIAWVERAAGVVSLAAVVALGIWQWDWLRAWLLRFGGQLASDAFRPAGTRPAEIASTFSSFNFLVAASVVACLLLGSVILYFVLAEEE